MTSEKLQRMTLIVGAVGAAVMVLLPPWQKADGDTVGYAPLFSPPTYVVLVDPGQAGVAPEYAPGGISVDRASGTVRTEPDRLVREGRPSRPPTFSTRSATLAAGRLITQLLLLGVLTGGAFLLVRTYRGQP